VCVRMIRQAKSSIKTSTNNPKVRDETTICNLHPKYTLTTTNEEHLNKHFYGSIITAPSNANNAELATIRPAPFVEELPAAVPVVDPLLAPEAAAPVAPDTDACDAVRADPETEVGDEAEALTEAVLEPKSCSEE